MPRGSMYLQNSVCKAISLVLCIRIVAIELQDYRKHVGGSKIYCVLPLFAILPISREHPQALL